MLSVQWNARPLPAVWWGKRMENGIWSATKPALRWMWKDHDSLYVALWKLRLRVMKPSAKMPNAPAQAPAKAAHEAGKN